jgi:hypothetical protein
MKAIILATIALVGCDVAKAEREASPLDMTCAAVYNEVAVPIKRCENAEVTCYLSATAIACLAK